VQTVVALINLGGQRLGLTESTQEAGDPEQTRVAIEAIRSLLPLLESDPASAEQMRPVRDALAQLQMAYAQRAGTPAEAPTATGAEGAPGEGTSPISPPDQPPSSARQSGRLWVPPGTKT
jgi:hypothetical protein